MSTPSSSSPLPNVASETAVDASTDSSGIDLSHQSKEFLVTRVQALERQLQSRNADCVALLQERKDLLPLKAKCESQKEMILALREQLSVMKAERDSAVDAVESQQRAARDADHDALKAALAMGGAAPSLPTAAGVTSTGTGQGARIVKTSHAGTQVIYDSSDISSLGFQGGGAAPYDFLGGMGAYRGTPQATATVPGQSRAPAGGAATTIADDSEDAEVQRAIQRASDEAQVELKHSQLEAQEEARLRARLEALRQGPKK